MKELILLLLFLPSISAAQELAIWDVEQIEVLDLASIELEVRIGERYFLVNGISLSSENAASAAVGSCFVVFTGDVICELSVRNTFYSMTIGGNLNGTIEIFDQDYVLIDEGNLFIRQ